METYEVTTPRQQTSVEGVPTELRTVLEKLVGRVDIDVVLQWCHMVFKYYASPLQHTEVMRPSPDVDTREDVELSLPASAGPTYPCPWCTAEMKLPKDFIRHVKEKCSAEETFRCPDCAKCFTRKQRFAKHHRTCHPRLCRTKTCSHVRQATVILRRERTLSCGFCKQLFHSDLHRFLRHLIEHYRQGYTLANWTAGLFVPMPKGSLVPPHVELSTASHQDNFANFTALKSGSGLSPQNIRYYDKIGASADEGPTLSHEECTAGLEPTAIADTIWPTDAMLRGMVPGHDHIQRGTKTTVDGGKTVPCMTWPKSWSPTMAFFQDIGHHLDDGFVLSIESAAQDQFLHTTQHSLATVQARGDPASERFSSSFDDGTFTIPEPRATEGLEPKDYRTSLSKRFFQAFQSLPQMRPGL